MPGCAQGAEEFELSLDEFPDHSSSKVTVLLKLRLKWSRKLDSEREPSITMAAVSCSFCEGPVHAKCSDVRSAALCFTSLKMVTAAKSPLPLSLASLTSF